MMVQSWLVPSRWRTAKQAEPPDPADTEPGELREFVYLDETSVLSLYASMFGAVPETITDTLNASLKSEAAAEVSADGVVAKGKVSTKFEGSRTSGSQILRKATVQATFRTLRARVEAGLVLGPSANVDVIEDLAVVRSCLDAADGSRWPAIGLQATELRRGSVVEVEVVLEADPVFRFSAALDAVSGMVKDHQDLLLSQRDDTGISQVLALNDIVDRLMVDLVPLRCVVRDYVVASADGVEYVLHHQVAAAHPGRFAIRPLILTGVAEQTSFSKDIRRILFSGSTFRVLARVGQTGLLDTWSPITMANVLGELLPDLARNVGDLPESARRAVRDNSATEQQQAALASSLAAHLRLAELLCQELGSCLTAAGIRRVEVVAAKHPIPPGTGVEGRRRALRATQELVEQIVGPIEDVWASELRMQAFEEASAAVGDGVPGAGLAPKDTNPGRILNVEFIAIYW